MIFNNWINWVKKDVSFEKLEKEIGSESDELFSKKAYKSLMYKDFVNTKISPGEKASSEIGNMYSASVFMSLLSMLNYHFDKKNEITGEK
jgi:hydroxymethylglutaryl-CoA synthase